MKRITKAAVEHFSKLADEHGLVQSLYRDQDGYLNTAAQGGRRDAEAVCSILPKCWITNRLGDKWSSDDPVAA